MAGTIGDVLNESARRLAAVSESPRFDAELLLAHCLGVTRSRLLAMLRESPALPPTFEACLQRRLKHEPIAYILGNQAFFGLLFDVHAPILCPRPETEHLVEGALAYLTGREGPRVLDLCSGSGCVGISIASAHPGSQLTATDLNPAACQLTAHNCAAHGIEVSIFEGDLFDALPEDMGSFDAIVSNPPYVEEGDWDGLAADIRHFEDKRALIGGADGLDLIRRIVHDAPRWLKAGGYLALELGEGQYAAVAGLLEARGYTDIAPRFDLAGIPRIAEGRWPRGACGP